jgi:ABC-type nitrate/sulfonate/bicarbonate transport system permease component
MRKLKSSSSNLPRGYSDRSAALKRAAEKIILGTAGIVALLIAWQICSITIGKYFPPPNNVARSIFENFSVSQYFFSIGLPHGGYAPHLIATTLNVTIGLAIGCALGCLTGFLSAYSAIAERIGAPVAWFVGTAPIMVVAPFALIWFGVSATAKIVLIALYTSMTIHVYAFRAASLGSKSFVEYGRTQGAPRLFCFVHINIPSAIPQIFGGLRIASAAAWGLAAITELLGSVEGIGRIIIATWGVYDLSAMMGGVLLIGFVAIVFDAVIVVARDKIVHWT